MKIFITHYTPLVERKKLIIQQLESYGFTNYEFIESYDKEVLTHEDLSKFQNIKTSEISLFLKHVEIFKMNFDDYVIVLEDDSIFKNDFKNNLEKYLKELDELGDSWDVAFTADCCNLHVPKTSDKFFYKSNGSRGTCMYIINKNKSSSIYQIYNQDGKIDKPIDHWFNKFFLDNKLKYLWSEPAIVEQGSEIGIFMSAIR